MIGYILSWIGQSSVAALLLLLLGYLCRQFIEARLTRSVQHEFDKKLAIFKERLDEETKRLDSVRGAGFAALLSQRNSLAAKRVEAAQGLWNAVLYARKGITVALSLEILKIEEVVKRVREPEIQTYLKAIGPADVMTDEFIAKLNGYAQHQPFVSPVAWALYTAYSTIIVLSISKLKMLQLGFDPGNVVKDTHWVVLLGKALLPADFNKIESGAQYNLHWALGRVEERIVDELRRSMAGESAGLEGVGDAHAILEAIDNFKAEQQARQQIEGLSSVIPS